MNFHRGHLISASAVSCDGKAFDEFTTTTTIATTPKTNKQSDGKAFDEFTTTTPIATTTKTNKQTNKNRNKVDRKSNKTSNNVTRVPY